MESWNPGILKLNYLRVRHVRWDSGEWRAGSKPWKGRVNFWQQDLGENTSRKDQKASSGGSAQVLHLIARWVPSLDLQVRCTCCKRNNCWVKLTNVDKDSTSSCTATVLDTPPPKDLNCTQFKIETRATYTECKDKREAWRRLNSSDLCSSLR